MCTALPFALSGLSGRKRLNNDRTEYALSPKDMCTVDILPEIIEAGVYSLKIEGRMKKPESFRGKKADRHQRGQTDAVGYL